MSKKDLNTTENINIMQDSVLKIIIADIAEISQSLGQIVLNEENQELQGLIEKINKNADKLNSINNEGFNNQSEKEILSELQGQLKELQLQLKQLPYSNHPIINNLCQAINTLLEKLADFFLNGPIVSEHVYIAIPSQPHHYHLNFFHPARSTITSAEHLLKDLNSFSTSP